MQSNTYRPPTQDRQPDDHQPTTIDYSKPTITAHSHALAGHGFAQKWGLHPGVAALTFILDAMIFTGDVASAGLLLPVSIGAAAVLGIITYKAQRRMYGDDDESALTKALVVGLLTAIPAPLPVFLSVPAGIIGLLHRKER